MGRKPQNDLSILCHKITKSGASQKNPFAHEKNNIKTSSRAFENFVLARTLYAFCVKKNCDPFIPENIIGMLSRSAYYKIPLYICICAYDIRECLTLKEEKEQEEGKKEKL